MYTEDVEGYGECLVWVYRDLLATREENNMKCIENPIFRFELGRPLQLAKYTRIELVSSQHKEHSWFSN